MKRCIFTASKRSLGQGNIFRRVCHSVPGGLCVMSLLVWLPGPMFLLRSLCLGGGLSLCRGSQSGGLCPGEPLSRGVSLQSGLCLGGLCPGGLCPGNLCTGDSVQGVYVGDGGGRAVRILLECFLVLPKQMKSPDPVSRFG